METSATPELISKVKGIPAGKSLSVRTASTFVQAAIRGGLYVVEAGREAAETHDDDYMSFPGMFKGGRRAPYYGLRYSTPDAAAATTVYARWKDELASGLRLTAIAGSETM